MKSLKFIILILISFSLCCNEIDFSEGAPKCIKGLIREFKKYACDDSTVDEYVFQNATVFVLNAMHCCCDVGSAVIDNECNQIGILDGFAGNKIINGEDFSHATYIRTIWDK